MPDAVYTSPNWLDYSKILELSVPPVLVEVIQDPASITKRFKSLCQHFRVELLFHDWGEAWEDEIEVLGTREKVLVREVVLYCDDEPVIYARTVMQEGTIGSEPRLLTLGKTSLGEVLFNHPDMKRSPFTFANLNKTHRLFADIQHSTNKISETLIARRSVFYLSGNGLLLSEVFL